MTPSFIHLKVHSAYSLLEGAIKVKELVKLCRKYNMPAVAITDSANLFGSMEFSLECKKNGIQPIIGCILNCEIFHGSDFNQQRTEFKLPVLAKNKKGYKNLLKLVSNSYLQNTETPSFTDFNLLKNYSEGLIALSGGTEGIIEQNLLANRPEEAQKYLDKLAGIFPDRFYIELNRHGLNEQNQIEETLIGLAYDNDIPLAATNDVYFPDRDMYEAHDALLCIAEGKYVDDSDRRRLNEEYYFKSQEEMEQLFSDIPEALENTVNIAKRCGFMSIARPPLLPKSSDDDLFDENEEFIKQAREGLEKRLAEIEEIMAKNHPPLEGGSKNAVHSSGRGNAKRLYSQETLEKAKELRESQTDTESLLWHYIRNKQLDGFKFKRQAPIGDYIVDFVCFEKKLVIELDGSQHAEQQNYDEKRTKFLEEGGFSILRFWNNQIMENMEGVLETILYVLNNPSPNSAVQQVAGQNLTLPQGEGDNSLQNDWKKEYYDRLEHEIKIIVGMEFPGYFLIVSDFMKWSKRHDVPVGPGRGSGAGSLVAWSLEITDLDPIRYGLLFERFLNPERVSMPDFDIDFCQEKRDRVIDYVQHKYGTEKVAQIITFGKLQSRIVLRDVGRVLNIPYNTVDRICKLVPFNPANPLTLAQAIEVEDQLQQEMEEDENIAQMIEIGLKLEGLNRHASTHAAGVVIAGRPLNELVPLYKDPRSEMPVVQYSMKYAEESGLVKFDFLGLKTLSVIAQACKFLKQRGIDLDISKLPEGDEKTYKMLGDGKGIGIFQLESSGMRDVLRKMKPDCLEDIIALVSLYRPGPMENIPTYINCKHGIEEPQYLHPLMEEILNETFGVIIYQEQVMEIARKLAGYTLGAADLLRRAMGKKIKSEMDAQREIFVDGAVKNGIEKGLASQIFDLIAKFASYGFNKSHAAAYAAIGYQTAYLKAHYPVEFIAASMNYDMHNTDKLGIFIDEAKSLDIKILPPDINKSMPYFSVEDGAIRYGLGAIKNVGIDAMEEMVGIREES